MQLQNLTRNLICTDRISSNSSLERSQNSFFNDAGHLSNAVCKISIKFGKREGRREGKIQRGSDGSIRWTNCCELWVLIYGWLTSVDWQSEFRYYKFMASLCFQRKTQEVEDRPARRICQSARVFSNVILMTRKCAEKVGRVLQKLEMEIVLTKWRHGAYILSPMIARCWSSRNLPRTSWKVNNQKNKNSQKIINLYNQNLLNLH